MTLMPLVSTPPRGVGASRAASTASELDCCAMGGTLAAAGPLIPDPPGVVDVPGAGGCDQAVDHAREQRGTLLRRRTCRVPEDAGGADRPHPLGAQPGQQGSDRRRLAGDGPVP